MLKDLHIQFRGELEKYVEDGNAEGVYRLVRYYAPYGGTMVSRAIRWMFPVKPYGVSTDGVFGPYEKGVLELLWNPLDGEMHGNSLRLAVPLVEWVMSRGPLLGIWTHDALKIAIEYGHCDVAVLLARVQPSFLTIDVTANSYNHHVAQYVMERVSFSQDQLNSGLSSTAIRLRDPRMLNLLIDYGATLPVSRILPIFSSYIGYHRMEIIMHRLPHVFWMCTDVQDGMTLLEWVLGQEKSEFYAIAHLMARNPHPPRSCIKNISKRRPNRPYDRICHALFWCNECNETESAVDIAIEENHMELAALYVVRGVDYDRTKSNDITRIANLRWTPATNATLFSFTVHRNRHMICLLCTFIATRMHAYPELYLPYEIWYEILKWVTRRFFPVDFTPLCDDVVKKIIRSFNIN